MIGRKDSQEQINTLQQMNLFIISLDEEQQWFRYHHLFRDMLQEEFKKQIAPEKQGQLRKRAAEWLFEAGHLEAAIKHSLLAGAIEQAAGYFKAHRQTLMNQMQWKTLDRLMAHFPANVIAADREMKLINLWILLYRGKREAVFEAAKQLDLFAQKEGLPGKGDQMYAELSTLLSWHYYDSEEFDWKLACILHPTL